MKRVALLAVVFLLVAGAAWAKTPGEKAFSKGMNSFYAKNYKEAVVDMTKGIESGDLADKKIAGDSKLAFAYAMRSKAYEALGDNAKALADIEKAQEIEPSAYNTEGWNEAKARLQKARGEMAEFRRLQKEKGPAWTLTNKKCYACLQKEDLKKLKSMMLVNDSKGVDAMEKSGRCGMLKPGTVVYIKNEAPWEGYTEIVVEGSTVSLYANPLGVVRP